MSEVEAEALDDGRNGFLGGWNGLWATIAIAVFGTAAGIILMLKKKKSARMELESSGSGSRRARI